VLLDLLGWVMGILVGLGGLLAGVGLTLLALRGRRPLAASAQPPAAPQREAQDAEAHNGTSTSRALPTVALLERALREPLVRLRRWEGCPPDALEQLEHLAWQARMLRAPSRPMQAFPSAPMTLLQEAAERVTLLRLGKVGTSWSLRNRQPVHVDPERAGAAFRELLEAAAQASGEGGRIAIRILPGTESGFPVRIEIEVGRRSAEFDPLAVLVARRLLEQQGGQVEADPPITRILLRAAAPDPEPQRGA
jgi:hypothetical protein